MPELPEVQTVVSQVGEKLTGKKIMTVWSDWQKRTLPSFELFAKRVQRTVILGTRRFGKHIVIDLDNMYSIVIHLKMTGHLLIKNDANRMSDAFIKDPMNGYIHHCIGFSDGTTLEFSDMRKFGWMKVLETDEVENLPSILSLGVDAISKQFTTDFFQKLIVKREKKSIGALLLEQNLIAGIGNIYRSEALFLAGVLPTRLLGTLSIEEQHRSVVSVKKVLKQALQLRGMSDGDFRDTDGLEGQFQKTRHVYGRTDEPCKKCGTIIVRKKIGQRSIFYCPKCQR
ncbi:MAG: DNA-formamidopyrimidine glycosylase [Candidatus Moranbacteria bacterium]|nr:DNA-formamidopyrimidine glycosylase [Candidatus Moranbacteria bacterium]MDD3964597.1 DNA-formamidopyrimidine glycosylase [Candidatus Moranbacteria bacterium]